MKPQIYNEIINVEDQKTAMIELIKQYWRVKNNEASLVKLVDILFEQGQQLGSEDFNTTASLQLTGDEIKRLVKEKESSDKSKNNSEKIYELSQKHFDLMTHKANKQNYDDIVSKALSVIKTDFPELKSIKPNNWLKYQKANANNEDNEFLDVVHEMEQFFKGFEMNVGSAYIWTNFAESISLPSVGYRNERGDKPLVTFAHSIIQEAYACQLHNNGVKKMEELKEWIESYGKNKKVTKKLK